jgi:hypothetical protein
MALLPPPHLPHRLVVVLSSSIIITATTVVLPWVQPPLLQVLPRAPPMPSFSLPLMARQQLRRRKRRKRRRRRIRRRKRAILLLHFNPNSNVAIRMLIPYNPGGGRIKWDGDTRRMRRDWGAVPHWHLPSLWQQQDQCPRLNFPHPFKLSLSPVSPLFRCERTRRRGGGIAR